MNKLSISVLLTIALLAFPGQSALAVDDAAPVVTEFTFDPSLIDLRNGAGVLRLTGKVTDPSGLDYVHFKCVNTDGTSLQPYTIAISQSASFKFPNLHSSISLNVGGFSSANMISKTFTGSSTDLSFNVSFRIPAELKASKCSWSYYSRDLLGNPSGYRDLPGQLETIDNTGGRYVTPTPEAVPAPVVRPDPTPAPLASPAPTQAPVASPKVTWAVSGSTLAISVKNALNRILRVDAPNGSDKHVITSDDQLIILTAYSGSANRIYLDGVQVDIAYVLSTEGVKRSSGKPIFSILWSGSTLSVTGTNVLIGSSIRILVGSSAIASFMANDSVLSASFDRPAAEVVKIYQGDTLSFNQQSAKYSSCAKLNAIYSGGLANKVSATNRGGKTKLVPTLSPKLYGLNRGLDRDKDGIACEK